MLSARNFFRPEDETYLIAMRRELHECPELGFELPRTAAAVKRELEAMGIGYTERYAPGSVTALLGQGEKTAALRADMDALPIQEETGLPFASKIPGRMHACGHDAHTAMLLTAARVLKRIEDRLPCRVKLIFQPSEECDVSGAQRMCENGVMDDVDLVVGQHVAPELPTGTVGVRSGALMAACHPYTIDFYGKSVHATQPQNGHDALAMAVKAYNDLYIMNGRELSPFCKHVLSVSSIHAGTVHNVIADHAQMLISLRFFEMEEHDFIDGRIRQICRNAAEEMGGTCVFTDAVSAPPLFCDPGVTALVRRAAAQALGEEKVTEIPYRLGSEDFAHFTGRRPGMMFRLGIGNAEKGSGQAGHTSKFRIDEDALRSGALVLVQTVLNVI